MRLVVDTNIMVRALVSPGPARRFFALAPRIHVLLYHAEQLSELRDVAARPRLSLPPEAVDELIARMRRYGEAVDSALDAPGECRDPQDECVLALARAGSADFVASENRDLLVLDPWRGIRIIRSESPSDSGAQRVAPSEVATRRALVSRKGNRKQSSDSSLGCSRR